MSLELSLQKAKRLLNITSNYEMKEELKYIVKSLEDEVYKKCNTKTTSKTVYNACMHILKDKINKNRPILQKAHFNDTLNAIELTNSYIAIRIYDLDLVSLPYHDEKDKYPSFDLTFKSKGNIKINGFLVNDKIPSLQEIKYQLKTSEEKIKKIAFENGYSFALDTLKTILELTSSSSDVKIYCYNQYLYVGSNNMEIIALGLSKGL